MPSLRPRARPAAEPLAELLGRLERGVVASRRERSELLREIEGDLREAVAARVGAGAPEATAASAVVAEFGDARQVATELSVELLAERGRRFAPVAAIAAVGLLLAWFVGMTTLAAVPGFSVPIAAAWMLPVSRALDVTGWIGAGAAVAGWLAIRRTGSLAALVAVAALQLAFASALVLGAVALVGMVAVPADGQATLIALVTLTVLVGGAMAAAAAMLLVRWGAVRLAPRRARA
ncbi:permease prefix domain 1-containing protein [Agrococcus beijingensis]|uniref:permease prefix domain 1-containing protein n=1 Tax=Agrococcus beijingensis TaxID=3068634 RepID=UPI0027409D4C|nr:permease prefix domain 1-containing protein [Agrococcus sp. REN33]